MTMMEAIAQIEDGLVQLTIESLEECDSCGKVIECVDYGKQATGYDQEASCPTFKTVWVCAGCVVMLETFCMVKDASLV